MMEAHSPCACSIRLRTLCPYPRMVRHSSPVPLSKVQTRSPRREHSPEWLPVRQTESTCSRNSTAKPYIRTSFSLTQPLNRPSISQLLRRWHSHGKSRALLREHRNEYQQVSVAHVRLLRGNITGAAYFLLPQLSA